MTRYYAAILFLVSALASNASAQQTKDGLLRGNNSGEAVGNMGDSGLGNRRLQAPSVTFRDFATDRSMKDISVNKDGSSGWGIGLDGLTYKFECFSVDRCDASWGNAQSNGSMSRLANSISFSGNSKHVWAVADKSSVGRDLYRGFTVEDWMLRDQPRDVSFKQLSVSFCGKHVWAVDTDGSVWYKEVSGKKEILWTKKLFSDSYSYVAVGKGDYVWAIVKDKGFIDKYDVTAEELYEYGTISANAKTISVDKSSTSVWVVGVDHVLYYSDGRGNSGSFTRPISNIPITTAAVSANGKKLFAVSRDEGKTLMAEIDTSTLAATVDEDEDEDCYHPKDDSKATIATVKST